MKKQHRRNFIIAGLASLAGVIKGASGVFDFILDEIRHADAKKAREGADLQKVVDFYTTVFGEGPAKSISGASGTENPRALVPGERGYAISAAEDALVDLFLESEALNLRFEKLGNLPKDDHLIAIGGPVSNALVREMHGYEFDPKTGDLTQNKNFFTGGFQFFRDSSSGSNPIYKIRSKKSGKIRAPFVTGNVIEKDYLILSVGPNIWADDPANTTAFTISGAKSLGTFGATWLFRDREYFSQLREENSGHAKHWQALYEVIGKTSLANDSPRVDSVKLIDFAPLEPASIG